MNKENKMANRLNNVSDEIRIVQRNGNDWNIDKRNKRFDDLLKTDIPLYMILK